MQKKSTLKEEIDHVIKRDFFMELKSLLKQPYIMEIYKGLLSPKIYGNK